MSANSADFNWDILLSDFELAPRHNLLSFANIIDTQALESVRNPEGLVDRAIIFSVLIYHAKQALSRNPPLRVIFISLFSILLTFRLPYCILTSLLFLRFPMRIFSSLVVMPRIKPVNICMVLVIFKLCLFLFISDKPTLILEESIGSSAFMILADIEGKLFLHFMTRNRKWKTKSLFSTLFTDKYYVIY